MPMAKTDRNIPPCEQGSVVVETPIILPIFLLFVLGIMEFGRAYWTLSSIQLAIDEAGRYAMLHTTASDSEIIATAQSNLPGLNPNQFTITSSSQTTNGINYKVITATYAFSFIAPGMLPFGDFTIARSTTVPVMR